MADYYRNRSEGFVIAKNDLREADQLFSFYSRDFGKVQILGRAIRKIKSKLRSGVDLLYFSELEFIQGKAYKTLTDSLAIDKLKGIRNDLDKLKVAYMICQTADALIQGQEKDDNIFNLLGESFEKLSESKRNPELAYYYFFWKLVSLLGYQIDLYHCPICQNRLSPDNLFFNPEEGGIACCANKDVKIDPEAVKIIRFLTESDWKVISKIKCDLLHFEGLKDFSSRYFEYIIKK